MKRTRILGIAAGFMILTAGFIGCTKEGPQGPPGQNGTNGTNGVDANATCTQCHNFSDTIVTKIFQYEASQHATGSTTFEGTRKDCAPCHTSQGYKEIVATNADTTTAPIGDANRIDCRTCHQIHKTYTESDWALLTTAAYNPRYDKSQTIDLAAEGGSGNLCGRCHQARRANPNLTNPTSMTDSVRINSFRWGPHYGTQSNTLAGKGAFEIGSSAYRNSPHANSTSCSTCHSGNPQGNLVGGHTLHMENEESGDNVNVCKTCHSSIGSSFDLNGKQTEIEGLLEELHNKLAEANIIDSAGYIIPQKFYKQKQLAAYWNYKLFHYDRSHGIHNYLYTKDALEASIAVFGK